jgi:type II secretory pathway component GspD/PulD (secretin)
VLSLLASEAGANIVADASLKPDRVTLHLSDVRFEDALDVLVRSRGLVVRREGRALIVGSSESMNRRYPGANSSMGSQTVVIPLAHARPDDVSHEIADALPQGTVIVSDKRTASVVVTGDADTVARARRLVAALDAPNPESAIGGTTQSYRLRYVKADDLLKQLKSIASDGTYVVDGAQNAVLVSGNDELQATAKRLIATIDIASPQVLFEVKVADVTPKSDSSNFGLEYGGRDILGNPVVGSTTYAFSGGSIPVFVQLNALIAEGRAEILATPRIVTLNNKEADLLIGQTYPVTFNTSVLGGQNIQFVDVGVKLRLTPTIGPDGVVTADLHPEYSEIVGFALGGFPIIANRRIDSTLRVKDNETIVLGGLMRDVNTQVITRVPGLSDIPVLGKFFQNKSSHRERDEIVFMITPHVIYPDTNTDQSRPGIGKGSKSGA